MVLFSASYAEICSVCIEGLLQEDCTNLERLGDTDPFIAVQNLKKQEIHSLDNVSSC